MPAFESGYLPARGAQGRASCVGDRAVSARPEMREEDVMTARSPSEPEKIQLTFPIHNQARAQKLEAAWREIVAGHKLTRTEVMAQDLEAIIECAWPVLERIESAIRQNSTTCERLSRLPGLPSPRKARSAPPSPRRQSRAARMDQGLRNRTGAEIERGAGRGHCRSGRAA